MRWGSTTGALAGLPQQRSGWAGGLLSGGEGGTWGCQGSWQVETQRPVTGGEHGSVREDRSEGSDGSRGGGEVEACLMR